MAIWQYDFWIVPKDEALKKYGNVLSIPIENDFIEVIPWKKGRLQDIKQISQILKQEKSWSNDIIQYGNIEGTCVQLFLGQHDFDIKIRLDLCNLKRNTFLAIVKFIQEKEAMILTSEGRLLCPDLEKFVSDIRTSREYKFVKNPMGYLNTIDR